MSIAFLGQIFHFFSCCLVTFFHRFWPDISVLHLPFGYMCFHVFNLFGLDDVWCQLLLVRSSLFVDCFGKIFQFSGDFG